jgi:repressor LexA
LECKERVKNVGNTTTEQGVQSRKKIMDFLQSFIQTNGYAPTVREICDGVGLASSSTVHKHLEILRDRGKITWNPSMVRTIRILEKKKA